MPREEGAGASGTKGAGRSHHLLAAQRARALNQTAGSKSPALPMGSKQICVGAAGGAAEGTPTTGIAHGHRRWSRLGQSGGGVAPVCAARFARDSCPWRSLCPLLGGLSATAAISFGSWARWAQAYVESSHFLPVLHHSPPPPLTAGLAVMLSTSRCPQHSLAPSAAPAPPKPPLWAQDEGRGAAGGRSAPGFPGCQRAVPLKKICFYLKVSQPQGNHLICICTATFISPQLCERLCL